MNALLSPAVAQRTSDAVRALEAHTSVELVVAVRPGVAGAAPSLVLAWVLTTFSTGVLLFMPAEVPLLLFFAVVVVSGVAGAAAGLWRPVRRWWLGLQARSAVDAAARAAFVELGVHHTSGRTGLLLFVAAREGFVALVGDRAVPALPAPLVADLEAAVARDDVDGFCAAITALRGPLATALPRAADDINELADGPVAA
jgi:putative membrane protein